MTSNNDIDLNAYIDGELTPQERVRVLEAIQQDPAVAREVCELNNLKSQLQLAYTNPPGIAACKVARGNRHWMTLAASVLMLAVGLLGGWLAGNETQAHQDRLVVLDPEGRGQAPATSDSEETRIVFHLTTPDQNAAGELLDDVEQMLAAYEADGRPLRVEIVSNGEGLALLRKRLSHYKARIHRLAQRYKNLTFVACKNTIKRLEVKKGIEVEIVPDAEIIDSGVSHVVKRQKEGWSYIRV